MQISNELEVQSFQFTADKPNMLVRAEEINDLAEIDIDGENVAKYKEITCSPHLKLINKGSDLRIYFYWCDKDVGNGEKVLVGRIGSHPY